MEYDILLSVLLAMYTVLILYIAKYVYLYSKKRGLERKDALYYNRKFVHIFAGGIVALFVPFYHSYYYPLVAGFLLAAVTLFSHEKGNRLYWFQNKKDLNDVTFCLMWGVSIFILWILFGSPWLAILPALFMAFGDGVTGIIRNTFFGKRTKHYIGNVFMAMACIPLGLLFGYIGNLINGAILAAIVASVIEHYEFGPIDDNILITISSMSVLIISYYLTYGKFMI